MWDVTYYKLKLLFYIISSILASRLYKHHLATSSHCHRCRVSTFISLQKHPSQSTGCIDSPWRSSRQGEQGVDEGFEVDGSCENSSEVVADRGRH